MTRTVRRGGAVETTLVWLAFTGVHLILGLLNFAEHLNAFGDVTHVYASWTTAALAGSVPAIDGPWVYPVLALVPMLMAAVVGRGMLGSFRPDLDSGTAYGVGWLLVVFLVTAALLAWLTRRGGSPASRHTRFCGAWWLVGLTAAVGPIATGRIDAITLPLVVAALLWVAHRPAVAGAALAIGAWIKVWPAAAFLAAVVASPRRPSVVAGGAIVTGGVVFVAALLGGWPEVASFVTEQTGRGLQIESTAATIPMVLAAFGDSRYDVAYDTDILTVQITGPGTEALASATTPIMVLLVVAITLLGVLARRSGASAARLLPPLALALTLVLIVTNKVGSPQFTLWIIAVVVAWIVMDPRRAAPVAWVALLIALFTNLIYPWEYPQVMTPTPFGVLLLVFRNGLELGALTLAIVAVVRSWRDARRAPRPRITRAR